MLIYEGPASPGGLNGSTVNPLAMEFAVGGEIIALTSKPTPGMTAVVVYRADCKTGEYVWATESKNVNLVKLMMDYLKVPNKQIQVGTVITANKVENSPVWSVVLSYQDPTAADLANCSYHHFFGLDQYHADATEIILDISIAAGAIPENTDQVNNPADGNVLVFTDEPVVDVEE